MSYLGLDAQNVQEVANSLNKLLAEYHLHYQKLRSFHWNIKGKRFFELHAKFEQLYNDAKLKIDEIAERILAIEQRPVSTIEEYLEIAKINEVNVILADDGMVRELLNDYGVLIADMRKVISQASSAGDEGTIDLIGGYLEDLEKSGWMLHAYLEHSSISRTDDQEQIRDR